MLPSTPEVDQESGKTPAGSRQELLRLTALSPRVPIFMSHGIYDEIISPGVPVEPRPFALGKPYRVLPNLSGWP